MPERLELVALERVLRIVWSDGRRSAIGHRALREACRCASCRRQGGTVGAAQTVELLEIMPFGPNAVRLRFSDGHERGIYPFAYLRELTDATGDLR